MPAWQLAHMQRPCAVVAGCRPCPMCMRAVCALLLRSWQHPARMWFDRDVLWLQQQLRTSPAALFFAALCWECVQPVAVRHAFLCSYTVTAGGVCCVLFWPGLRCQRTHGQAGGAALAQTGGVRSRQAQISTRAWLTPLQVDLILWQVTWHSGIAENLCKARLNCDGLSEGDTRALRQYQQPRAMRRRLTGVACADA